MKVQVAIYEHRHGTDVRVFQTEEGVEKWRQAIAQEWWDGEMDHDMPEAEPPTVIADLYFNAMAERSSRGESFSSEEAEVQP